VRKLQISCSIIPTELLILGSTDGELLAAEGGTVKTEESSWLSLHRKELGYGAASTGDGYCRV
jgi:hypothetical protein